MNQGLADAPPAIGALLRVAELEPYRTRLTFERGSSDEESLRVATVKAVVANGRGMRAAALRGSIIAMLGTLENFHLPKGEDP